MPKQNALSRTKKRKVTFAKKPVSTLYEEDIVSRALASSHIGGKRIKSILKKSSYKKENKSLKNVQNKKKSV